MRLLIRILHIATALVLLISVSAAQKHAPTIRWDQKTLVLVQHDAGYPRAARVRDGVLCCFERGGGAWVKRSTDGCATWGDAVEAARSSVGNAANPELLVLRDGKMILFWNERRGGGGATAIRMSASADDGKTWQPRADSIFTGGTERNSGCWEPAAVQLPSGEIQLFFANEGPYANTHDQEISLTRSRDGGKIWTKPVTVSYRKGGRDGMPVPVILANGRGIAFAIEDSGITAGHKLQPAVIHSATPNDWPTKPVTGDDKWRWNPLAEPLANDVYAGAPYLRQLPGGLTVLSCQSTEGRSKERMVVYVGDPGAKNFAGRSEPFKVDDDSKGEWNSLYAKDAKTVVAFSTTRIGDVHGVWAIQGTIE